MSPALADVLARPDIWRGDSLARAPLPALASGFAALDAELPGGGWPRGQLTELLSERAGAGEVSLLLPALARITAAGGAVVVIAEQPVFASPHAPAWAAAGVRLDRVYWLTPRQSRDTLWCALEALRCRGVAATLFWATASSLRVSNALRRLQVAAAEGAGCAFVFRPASDALQSSPASLRLRLTPCGEVLQLEVLKRRGMPLRQALRLHIPRPAPLRRILSEPLHALAFDNPHSGSRSNRVVA